MHIRKSAYIFHPSTYAKMRKELIKLATPHKLRQIERERGNLQKIIPSLVNQKGQSGAALILGVSTSTISQWLKANGYRQKITYEKEQT